MVVADENEVQEPDFSDPPGFRDDVPDGELVGDVLKQNPDVTLYQKQCVVVFGIPAKVNQERLPKLKTVMKKIFSSISPDYFEHYPLDENNETKGCCFVEFLSPQIAEHAVAVLHGYKLDKAHTFIATTVEAAKKLKAPDPNEPAPAPRPYNDVGDLSWWLQNPKCRDQFSVSYSRPDGPYVAVYWNMKGNDPQLVDEAHRPNWTESRIRWSPHGSILATQHSKGVCFWAGEKFANYQKFWHANANVIDFSPNEKFFVSFSAVSGPWTDDTECLRVWDTHTGELRKSFSLYDLIKQTQLPYWPLLQWSHDERYVALYKLSEGRDRVAEFTEPRVPNSIVVWETENWKESERKIYPVDGLKTFKWSPTDNVIAYHSSVDDKTDEFSEFVLMAIPSGHKLRRLKIFKVCEATMFWQKSGLRLAVHDVRYTKRVVKAAGEITETKYQGMVSNIEIFDLTEKEVPVQNLQLPEPFINFGWEPTGDKFCVLTGTQNKVTPCIFRVDKSKPFPVLMSKLDPGVQLNGVAWAPAGGWLAVYAAQTVGGNVLFIDTNRPEAQRTNQVEHPFLNKICWDPTGRYLATCVVTGGRATSDYGFRIYTFQGRELCRMNVEKLNQFDWRPRPPVRLSEQKIKSIKKSMKTISARFEKEDNEEKVKASQEVIDKRRVVLTAFEKIRRANRARMDAMRELRIKLRNGLDTETGAPDERDLVEETITIALNTQKELIPADGDD